MSAVRDAVEVGVALERRDGVARITLDRPPLNILDIAALERLDVVLKDIAADPTVAVLLVTGRGRAFCAGLDVADHMGDRVGPMLDAFHRVIGRLLECEAAVQVSGGENSYGAQAAAFGRAGVPVNGLFQVSFDPFSGGVHIGKPGLAFRVALFRR